MSEIKLLPCPFCGGEAEISINKTSQGQTSNVRCSKCTCKKALLKYPFYGGDIEKDAIEDWNTRKPMERILARLKGIVVQRVAWFGKKDEICIGVDKAIEIVKEEGGIE